MSDVFRGAGMDAVVATARDALAGDLTVESSPGEGTRITLTLPER